MISEIREALKSHRSHRITGHHYSYAGVIVPLFEKDGEVYILLTRRSDGLRHHQGEVSFPGGMCEDGDENTMDAAIRECNEEVGVNRDDIEIMGALDDEVTIAGIVITPYVGVIPYPYNFVLNPKEVAYLIELPLNHLLKSEDYSSMYFGEDYIWGLSWGMLSNLKALIRGRRG